MDNTDITSALLSNILSADPFATPPASFGLRMQDMTSSRDTDIFQARSHSTAVFCPVSEQGYAQSPYTPHTPHTPHMSHTPDSQLALVTLQQKVQQHELQIAQLQRMLVQQQQQHQHRQHTQHVTVYQPSVSLQPQALSQQPGSLNGGHQHQHQLMHTWSTELPQPLENRDVWGQTLNKGEQQITDQLPPHELLQRSSPNIGHYPKELHEQQSSSSSNPVLGPIARERNNEGESEEKPHMGRGTHTAAKAKRTRKPLRLQRRLEIIAYWEASENKSKAALGRKFGIPRSTVYRIINDRHTLKRLAEVQSHSKPTLERYRVGGLRPCALEERPEEEDRDPGL